MREMTAEPETLDYVVDGLFSAMMKYQIIKTALWRDRVLLPKQ